MQGSFFGWVGWHGTVCVPNVFIFVTKKSPTFKRQKYRGKTEKNLIYLNSHTYYVIYCPYCPITSKLKWNASVPRFLLSPSQPLFGFVTQRPLFPVWERARVAWRDQIKGCLRDYAYCRSSDREKIKIICLQLVTSKIQFRVIFLRKANSNFVVLLIDPDQRHSAISNRWRYIQ